MSRRFYLEVQRVQIVVKKNDLPGLNAVELLEALVAPVASAASGFIKAVDQLPIGENGGILVRAKLNPDDSFEIVEESPCHNA